MVEREPTGRSRLQPPSENHVIPLHLIATRMTLDAFGITPPSELAAQLRAS
ncbi:hypothetical protein FTUN_2840 [Frigoriglobus tundricola]|uniref:Uncharacterized protein n=1 Tax=Frigoriglobus tundricola TaxID=2774151 RepID=A0A6M5YMY9_9BACT|nr:hypothetical protein FTUN_2840 [Frigoriglobus tundricola]